MEVKRRLEGGKRKQGVNALVNPAKDERHQSAEKKKL